MQSLSQERIGRFTASSAWKLWIGARGGEETRNTYIREKAEEKITGRVREFSNKDTDHGHQYELEGIEMFALLSGLIVEPLNQKYFPINEDSGATPDARVINFDGHTLATVDLKCPTKTFYKQKIDFIQKKNPEYQFCSKDYFIQGQIQMLSASIENAKLGLPPVEKHYLVRYFASTQTDFWGNDIEFPMPLESRMFWAEITADKKWQNEFLEHVETASEQRDLIAQIMLQPIIPMVKAKPQKDYFALIQKGKELLAKVSL